MIGLVELGRGLKELGIGLIELGIGLKMNNARRTVLARVSGLVLSISDFSPLTILRVDDDDSLTFRFWKELYLSL